MNKNFAHELAHALLEHPERVALVEIQLMRSGCLRATIEVRANQIEHQQAVPNVYELVATDGLAAKDELG